MVVGGGRSTRAGGGARRWRGIRPNQGDTVQLNGSGSFTRDQGRCLHEDFEIGSPDCSVYVWPWATEVWRRWSWVSGEVLPGPRAWKTSRATVKLTERQAQLGRGWNELATVVEAWAAMSGGEKLAGAKEGRLASEGEHGVRWGAPGVLLKARASAAEGRLWQALRACAGERQCVL
jgi:hypothetical protein